MKNKYLFITALSALLLTGCGTSDEKQEADVKVYKAGQVTASSEAEEDESGVFEPNYDVSEEENLSEETHTGEEVIYVDDREAAMPSDEKENDDSSVSDSGEETSAKTTKPSDDSSEKEKTTTKKTTAEKENSSEERGSSEETERTERTTEAPTYTPSPDTTRAPETTREPVPVTTPEVTQPAPKVTQATTRATQATTKAATKATTKATQPPVVYVNTMSVDQYMINLSVGGTASIRPVYSPSNASVSLSWESNRTDRVTVDNKGNVKGVGTGSAIITVRDSKSGLSASCMVTVS